MLTVAIERATTLLPAEKGASAWRANMTPTNVASTGGGMDMSAYSCAVFMPYRRTPRRTWRQQRHIWDGT